MTNSDINSKEENGFNTESAQNREREFDNENDDDFERETEFPTEPKEQQPLLRALIARADRNGHTLQHLAATLGVSYERLNQWRRSQSHIAYAKRSVHENAARYLGIPMILVQVLSERITLSDLFWPSQDNLEFKVEAEIRKLYEDPFLGAFIPKELAGVPSAVKLFVLFLYRELNSSGLGRLELGSASWLRAVRDAMTDKETTIEQSLHLTDSSIKNL